MNTCIYCSQPFELATDEHILQNFLGARKTSSTIVLFGGTIDSAFEKDYSRFGTSLEQRAAAVIRVRRSRSYRRVVVESLTLNRVLSQLNQPLVGVSPRPDNASYDVNIELGHINQLGWAMKKLRDLIPGYPITEEFLSGIAQPHKAPLNDYVQLGLKLGGLDYFRGVLKAAFNLFASEHRSEALQPAFDPLRQFVENGSGSMSDFVRWIITDAELGRPRVGEIDHAIVIRTIGASVEGVVQLFGDIVHPIRLTKTYAGPPGRVFVVCRPTPRV
jgi:hypothetical protein